MEFCVSRLHELIAYTIQQLAAQIPTLQGTDPSRLSKHIVVNESLSLHQLQKAQIDQTLSQMNAILTERDELLAEVNRWRAGAGIEPQQAVDHVPFEPLILNQAAALGPELDGWEDDSEEYDGVPLHPQIHHVGPDPVTMGLPPMAQSASANEPAWDSAISIPTMDDVNMNVIDPTTIAVFRPNSDDDFGLQLRPQTRTSDMNFLDQSIQGSYSFQVA